MARFGTENWSKVRFSKTHVEPHMRLKSVSVEPTGAACSNSQPPPPPPDPPKFSNPFFSKLRFWAKWAAPQALNIFRGHAACSRIPQHPYMCILKMFSSHWGFRESRFCHIIWPFYVAILISPYHGDLEKARVMLRGVNPGVGVR